MSINYSKKRYRPVLSLVIAVLLTGLLIRVFVLDTFTIVGNSMAPTFIDGDYVFVNKMAYWLHNPQREEVVVFNFRQESSMFAIKRVIGLPGEWVFIDKNIINIQSDKEGGLINTVQLYDPRYINQQATSSHYRLDPNEYYLVGDNGLLSVDSRNFGPVDVYGIQGKVLGAWRMGTFDWVKAN